MGAATTRRSTFTSPCRTTSRPRRRASGPMPASRSPARNSSLPQEEPVSRSRHLFGPGLLALLTAAVPAAAAERALIVYDFQGLNEPVAAGHIRDILLARGFSVDEADGVPS